jgi:hypothetical protein
VKLLLAALLLCAPAAHSAEDDAIQSTAGVEKAKKKIPKKSLDLKQEKKEAKSAYVEDVEPIEKKSDEPGSDRFKRSQLKPARKSLLKPIKPASGGY